jgi:chromosome segregation protein
MPKRLKSLQLQGYKTFASRYTFEFADSITAIVGPNGSGKSNIVDAMRWVLGEQAYSLLRGKRTEDMIFSGSEQRSRAGMAESSVLFDNSDGWLPIDFSEVAITRRAYRDGQNEYLINDQKVRLKDVSELLAKSGLAERTYTIIGQGLVDAALSLRADERRRLFEEAAGIGLYRTRREEALRRLESTQRNLDRVQDILAELSPRLRSLERQARRTREYEQIQADLRDILREWYGYHWHNSQKLLVEAQGYAKKQEQILEAIRSEYETKSQSMSGLRDQIQALRSQVNSWHRQLAVLHNRRDEIGREIAVSDERTRSLNQQLNNQADESVRLDEQLGLLENRLAQAQEELTRSQEELMSSENELAGAQQALASRQTERAKIQEHQREVQRKYDELQTLTNQTQVRLSERLVQQDKNQQEQVEIGEKIEQSRRVMEQSRQVLDEAQKTHLQAAEAVVRAEKEWTNHQSQQEEIENQQRKSFSALAEARSEVTRLNTELKVLEQAEQALVGYAEGTQVLLEAARSARLAGTTGALSSKLEVPAAYERAIAAALGDFVDAVILEDNADLEKALDLVLDAGVRGALLPLKQLITPEPVSIPEMAGVLGLAADLVNASPEIRPAIDLLLGSVYIVENRRAARQLLSSSSEPLRAVTLRGEVFHASGLVAANNLGGNENGGNSLSRTRHRKEVSGQLEAEKKHLKKLESDLKDVEQSLATHQQAGEQIHRSLEQARAAERQAARDLDRARLDLERAEQQFSWHSERLEQLQTEHERGELSLVEYRQLLAEAESSAQDIQADLKNLQHEIIGLPEDDYQEQVAHWRTKQAVAREAVVSLERSLLALQEQMNRLNSGRSGLEERRSRLEKSLEEVEAQIVDFRDQDREINSQIEQLQEVLQPAEEELEGLEQNQLRLLKQEEKIRQAQSAAEHRHAQARITLNKRLDAVDTLQQRIEDDFGLVAYEYEQEVSGHTPLPLDGMVEKLPIITEISPELEDDLQRKRAQLRRMGAVNPEAQIEYKQVNERYEFMTSQVADLEKAEADIREVIAELDEIMRQEFQKTFQRVAAEFKSIFTRLFGGGSAQLIMTDPDDITNTGIDIEARLPGRRTQGLSLLSGGERSLTAAALVFSLLKTSPTPFCVLDEVDAMLDEANVGRFRELLKELSQNTQFIVVTHNRNTVQAADIIYGVTMGKDSTSQVLSLRLDQVAEVTFES